MKPLNDTIRLVDWEELPARVRSIPEGFNPLEKGVLMKHQIQWNQIKSSIKAAEKGRRTGITFAEAMDDTIIAASRKSAGGDNIYYVGDTKEKGLEFIGYCARFARVIAKSQGQDVSDIEQFLFEDQDKEGNTKNITAYRIRFASGFQVVALSSRPANIRGLQGIVVIDEAAYHQDVQGVIDAAMALLIWGGKIRIISTHNSKSNPYYQLIKDIKAGQYGGEEDAQVFRVTFDDAVENGLYERVCMMSNQEATAEGKEKWYKRIRNAYGPRRAAMREELDAIARDGGMTSIPGVWIENAMREERPVLRLVLNDDFVKKPTHKRVAYVDGWIETYLRPLLNELKGREYIFGMDFARHRDFTVIIPAEITQLLHRKVPFIIELQKVPARQQEQILWAMIEALPRFSAGAIDATGIGMTIAEYTADKFGAERIHQINLSRSWYAEFMPELVDAFEDQTIDLPRDADIENDIRAIQDIDGIPMVPKVRTKDLKEPELYRHADSAIALALMWFASLHRSSPIDYTGVPSKASRWDGPDDNNWDDDSMIDDLNLSESGGW